MPDFNSMSIEQIAELSKEIGIIATFIGIAIIGLIGNHQIRKHFRNRGR